MTHPLHRPEPVPRGATRRVDHTAPLDRAAGHLRAGGSLMVSDSYSTGAEILARLEAQMPPPPADAPWAARQAARRALRAAQLRLIAPIKGHELALSGARPIGFLEELYPELRRFHLPFVQVQELYGAWERYREGVRYAALARRLHPFYGAYAPRRTAHLELFATWLSGYRGARGRAIDVGTGCGVLAFMLCRAGFEWVLATDINPNAIESVRRELLRLPAPPLAIQRADLLDGVEGPADLIAFNPPWIQGDVESPLDAALYFEGDLFERFFDQAAARLAPEGRIAVIFSNVLRLVRPDVPHPIEAELERGRLRLVQKTHRRIKPGPARAIDRQRGRRRKTRERVEVWELARA